MIACLFGAGGQVVGIDADAMTADETGGEGQEIPFGPGGAQDFGGPQAEAVEDQGQFVHQGDVDVALDVFDDLRGFSDLDGGGTVKANLNDFVIDARHTVKGCGVLARDDLGDFFQRVQLVARVDAFGGIAELKVDALFQAADFRQGRAADIFGDAGIDGRFKHDHITFFQDLANGAAGGQDGFQIRLLVGVDRGGDGDDEERAIPDIVRVGGKAQSGFFQGFGFSLAGGILAFFQGVDAALADIEPPDRVEYPGQRQRDRQADISQADHGDFFTHQSKPFNTLPLVRFFVAGFKCYGHGRLRIRGGFDIECAMDQQDISIDFFRNGALLVDPLAFEAEKRAWPLPPTLPSAIYDKIVVFWFAEIAANTGGMGDLLRPLFGLAGLAAFNLYYQKLAACQRATPHPAIRLDETKPFSYVGHGVAARHGGTAKEWLAAWGQKLLIRLMPLSGRRPRLYFSGNLLVECGRFAPVYRLRCMDGIRNVFRKDPKGEDQALLEAMIARFAAHIKNVAMEFGTESRPEDLEQLVKVFRTWLFEAYSDAEALEMLTRGVTFDCVEGSLSSRLPCLLGVTAVRHGGEAHSTCHGEYFQTMNMADTATILNASVFWAPTPAIGEDCRESLSKLPAGMKAGAIDSLNLDVAKPYRDKYIGAQPPKEIKTILILARHVPVHYSADYTLDFPCIIDFYAQLTRILCDAGYDVIFKAHPESLWRHFDKVIDPRAKVEWKSFERAGLKFDAVIMDNMTSTVVPDLIARPVHLFILGDEWNDRSLSSRQKQFFDTHARRLGAELGEDGFYKMDKAFILQCLKNPAAPDASRIDQFYGTVTP